MSAVRESSASALALGAAGAAPRPAASAVVALLARARARAATPAATSTDQGGETAPRRSRSRPISTVMRHRMGHMSFVEDNSPSARKMS